MRLEQLLFRFTININLQPFTYTDLSGDDSIEVTPDPIPNSEVKLYNADGTARETSVGE